MEALYQMARTFRINPLTVDYGAIAREGLLENGAVVTYTARCGRANVLPAINILKSTGFARW